jgi:hypothetical protein
MSTVWIACIAFPAFGEAFVLPSEGSKRNVSMAGAGIALGHRGLWILDTSEGNLG